jgi:hypothetical protein
MKPTRVQNWFAQDWPLKIWLTVIPALTVAAAVWACGPSLAVLGDWTTAVRLAAVVILALPLGWFAAILVGWFVLGPLYYDQGLKNGAPFQPGDRVRILIAPHRDRLARVYSLWQGACVRVELGEEEKETFQDIFSPTQLLREPSPEPHCAPRVLDASTPDDDT